MLSFLRNHSAPQTIKTKSLPITVDVHAHILPNIDDGPDSIEESLQMLESLHELGYQKVIATPHVMGNFYENNEEKIRQQYRMLQKALKTRQLQVQVEVAAVYYVDDFFLNTLRAKKPLITFGDSAKYLLFETPLVHQPEQLFEVVSLLVQQDYTPVLAHPERCVFLQRNYQILLKLKEMGVVFQLNINSLAGYYSHLTQLFAERMIDEALISFLGTDCYRPTQIAVTNVARSKRYFYKAVHSGLLNNTLI